MRSTRRKYNPLLQGFLHSSPYSSLWQESLRSYQISSFSRDVYTTWQKELGLCCFPIEISALANCSSSCLFEPFMWLTSQYFLWLPLSDINDLSKNSLAEYWPYESRALENHTWFSGRAGMLGSVKPQEPSKCWPAKNLCWRVQFCTEMLIPPQTIPVIVCNK